MNPTTRQAMPSGVGGQRRFRSRIPAALERLQIPRTGSHPVSCPCDLQRRGIEVRQDPYCRAELIPVPGIRRSQAVVDPYARRTAGGPFGRRAGEMVRDGR